MLMRANKWAKYFISISLFSIIFLMILNYTIDPFNIFHVKLLKHQFQQNERFMKIEFLEKNHDNFNGYMFGSSRIGTTNPKSIEKYLPGSNVYNFTLASANFHDYAEHLRYFIKSEYPIQTLYLQLDINNMFVYGQDKTDFLRKTHPYLLDKSLVEYYFSYLTGIFPVNIVGKLNINSTNNTNNDKKEYFIDTGVWGRPDREKRISNNCDKYVKNEPSFHKAVIKREIGYTKSSENIKALKSIKEMAENNNINLHVFTTPPNHKLMDSFKIKDYLEYLRDIASVVNFYDFSGYNSITLNNCNYYESKHYRPHIGDMIAARVFSDRSKVVPADFGVFVTKKNIDKHLKRLNREIEEYDLIKARSL
jgi:hypothetical protein